MGGRMKIGRLYAVMRITLSEAWKRVNKAPHRPLRANLSTNPGGVRERTPLPVA